MNGKQEEPDFFFEASAYVLTDQLTKKELDNIHPDEWPLWELVQDWHYKDVYTFIKSLAEGLKEMYNART